MKKTTLLMAALPMLSLAAGYGAGPMLLPAEASVPAPKASEDDDARAYLEARAEQPAAPNEVAPAAEGHTADEDAETPAEPPQQVVNLGRMTVPVYKPRSVTYVVADFGVSVGAGRAEHYRVGEHAARLRDAILQSMARAASGEMMAGAAIDTELLSKEIGTDIRRDFADVEDVLFLSLFKTDVPRS